jgi:hypothetical protein
LKRWDTSDCISLNLPYSSHNPLVPCSTHGGGTIYTRGTNFFAITDSQDKNTNSIIFDARDDTKISDPVFPELAQFGSFESLAEFPWVTTPAPKHKYVATKGATLKNVLHNSGQAIKALAHISHPSG